MVVHTYDCLHPQQSCDARPRHDRKHTPRHTLIMKITTPLKSFDLQGLLTAVADFTDQVCGEEFQASTLATIAELDELYEMDWDDLPRYERAQRFPQLEEKLKSGETLILIIASPYGGEPVSFVDGKDYDLSEDEDFPGGDTDASVLFVKYNSHTGDLTIETGMQCGGGCSCPPSLERGSIGSLEKPAEEFVRKFIIS